MGFCLKSLMVFGKNYDLGSYSQRYFRCSFSINFLKADFTFFIAKAKQDSIKAR
jgi:hypothetical protein